MADVANTAGLIIEGKNTMSLAVIKGEVERFITSTRPEVLCLQGGWGVGKTHLWNTCLRDAETSDHAGLEAYSYVSLFGLNNISDLRMSVFERRRSLKSGGQEDSGKGLLAGLQKMANFRSRGKLLKALPGVANLSDEEIISLLSVADSPQQIVCIDDVERRGDGLNVKDILGFASFLKEERKCKVIIILNDEELDRDGQQQMSAHLEKVVDVSLTMKPTSAEAVSIALTRSDDLSKQIAQKCRTLGVPNIRAIRRAEKFARSIMKYLDGCENKTKDNVISSVILFSWSRDQPGEAPTTEFLKSLTSTWKFFALDQDGDEDNGAEAAQWKPLLEAYGYGWTDDLDLTLMDGVAAGYFDLEKLIPLIAEFNARISSENADSSFNEAWQLYHDSFGDNEVEVGDALFASFKKNFQHITPSNALGTFRILKDFGREAEAKELVNLYVAGRDEGRAFFDLDQNHFIEGEIDPYFRTQFDKKRDELSEVLDFKETLLSVGDGWNSERLAFLADAPVEKYYETFKGSEGEELRKLLANATSFRRIVNSTDEMSRVTQKTISALEQIGKASRINARRVRRFGVKIDPASG
ncbi:P-loop NTPase fold protein [Pseudovibrio sp. POLY-S9]|uniref:P-loop NTPase fold protein n=1 Tax=Pseudovibrio sp. POLY-S9 TaxID=1576596 RepID=UPI0007097885|nr:P-loop NTPase fold protein [Pseudovibrio sp. POLY-S9]